MYLTFKRLFDIVVSTTVLVILLPLFIILVLLLKFSAEGEVFYFQERIGLHNNKFKIWKFATMLKDSCVFSFLYEVFSYSLELENLIHLE